MEIVSDFREARRENQHRIIIKDILVPALLEMKNHFMEKPFVFQQDGAPAHTSKKTQEWCKSQFPNFWSKEMWPPSSPDLNPMDFSVWAILESEACAKAHKSVDDLKASLKRAWSKIPQEKLRAAVASFRGRLEATVKANGGHIEI